MNAFGALTIHLLSEVHNYYYGYFLATHSQQGFFLFLSMTLVLLMGILSRLLNEGMVALFVLLEAGGYLGHVVICIAVDLAIVHLDNQQLLLQLGLKVQRLE